MQSKSKHFSVSSQGSCRALITFDPTGIPACITITANNDVEEETVRKALVAHGILNPAMDSKAQVLFGLISGGQV